MKCRLPGPVGRGRCAVTNPDRRRVRGCLRGHRLDPDGVSADPPENSSQGADRLPEPCGAAGHPGAHDPTCCGGGSTCPGHLSDTGAWPERAGVALGRRLGGDRCAARIGKAPPFWTKVRFSSASRPSSQTKYPLSSLPQPCRASMYSKPRDDPGASLGVSLGRLGSPRGRGWPHARIRPCCTPRLRPRCSAREPSPWLRLGPTSSLLEFELLKVNTGKKEPWPPGDRGPAWNQGVVISPGGPALAQHGLPACASSEATFPRE